MLFWGREKLRFRTCSANPPIRVSIAPLTEIGKQISAGDRFRFGENWLRYLRAVDDSRISAACVSLQNTLNRNRLDGLRFLDIGSGSGLFSLAARHLGGLVHSFDYDPCSVACTKELKRRYFPDDPNWQVEEGSVLNREFLASLGKFEVVYAWGVLHHTGTLWQALDNALACVDSDGCLLVAIYNNQGLISRYWTWVKRAYNHDLFLRAVMIVLHAPYLYGARVALRTLKGRSRIERGMSLWYDMLDWLGGYPFETATAERVIEFCQKRGFDPVLTKTCGRRHGCNEFVFLRTS